ncbi:MAG: hypothetical protein JWR17_1196 [Pseudomonas sp.]|nr:hypothetical protein [Pseudomonas sp.]
MVDNDNAATLTPRNALRFIAGKPASTGVVEARKTRPEPGFC